MSSFFMGFLFGLSVIAAIALIILIVGTVK